MSNPLPIAIDSDKVATITLEPNQGPMVILDHALIQRIEATLKSLTSDLAGVILASGSDRVFVAGADLKSIDAMGHDELGKYLAFGQRVFGMFCNLPCPTVAAINGAALGGGLELAMHCDGLVAAPAAPRDGQPPKPYPIGLPEAGLMICPGWGGTNLLPARMRDRELAIRITALGQPMLLDAAITSGLIDRAAPSHDTLRATAKAWLMDHRTIAAKRRDAQPLHWIGRPDVRSAVTSALTKLQSELPKQDPASAVLHAVHAGLEHGWISALKVEREELNRLRAAPAGKAAITAFLNKSKK